MPKRLVDGDAIATSKTLKTVREEFRIHYPYLLTLALGNGSFECDSEIIWQQMYALLLPSVTPAFVAEMLDEFERAKMLFRWKVSGKVWGHWVGQLKKGRLPSPSRDEHWKLGAPIPAKKLEKFTGRLVNQRLTSGQPVATTGNGTGSGTGDGNGNGIGAGYGDGVGGGTGGGDQAAPAERIDSIVESPALTFTSTTTTPESNDNEGVELEEPKAKPASESIKPHHIRFLTLLLNTLLDDNEHCKEIPPNFRKLWDADFQSMLGQYSLETVTDVVWLSQVPINQKYFVRAQKIKENLDSLIGQIEEDRNQKVMKVLKNKYPSLQTRMFAQAKQEVQLENQR